MKSCSKCKELKPITEFSKDITKKSGYQSQCKVCIKVYKKANADRVKEYNKQYYKTNADRVKEYYQANEDKLKERRKQYRKANADRVKEYLKQYQKANRDKINSYITERRKRDPLYKLKHNTRNLIRQSIKNNGYTKNSKTNQILGCSYEQFKQHIELQFTEGMNWDNRNLWHLDHIIPISLGLTEEEILALNHYTNFQPLWAEDNIQKSNNIHWTKCKDKYK